MLSGDAQWLVLVIWRTIGGLSTIQLRGEKIMCKKNYVGSIHNGLKSNKARLANKRASARLAVFDTFREKYSALHLDCTAIGIGDLSIPHFDILEGKADE